MHELPDLSWIGIHHHGGNSIGDLGRTARDVARTVRHGTNGLWRHRARRNHARRFDRPQSKQATQRCQRGIGSGRSGGNRSDSGFQAERPHRVRQSRAGTIRVTELQRRRGFLQDLEQPLDPACIAILEAAFGEVRMVRQHKRGQAGDMRRRHRGTVPCTETIGGKR